MPTIREALKARGLRRIALRIQKSAKPSIRLTATTKNEGACSRIGGRPNLPRGLDWPQWKDRPLAFLAQFDLATLPEIPEFDLPRTGSLFFFHQGGENPEWGYDPKHRGCAQVLYSDRKLKESALRSQPRAVEKERRYGGLKLRIEPIEATMPDANDTIVEGMGLSTAEWDRYNTLLEDLSAQRSDVCHRMAGYPDHLQGNMRLEAQLVSNGLYCGDSSGYRKPKAKRLAPGAVEWELLLQIDSERRAGMMWGDMGRIYFLIRRDDLRERRFDKIWAILQCC